MGEGGPPGFDPRLLSKNDCLAGTPHPILYGAGNLQDLLARGLVDDADTRERWFVHADLAILRSRAFGCLLPLGEGGRVVLST